MSLRRGTLVLACGVFACAASSAQEHNVRPPRGLVSDARTDIAVAVWTPIYGEKTIAFEKPYVATLEHGQWTVRGSLPEGWLGGVAIAVISKSDGRVLRVSHGK